MTVSIIAFNGPPKVGKDTVAKELVPLIEAESNRPILTCSLVRPLRRMAMMFAGYAPDQIENETDYELFKLRVIPALGINGRQLMIQLSEEFFKPKFDKTLWTKHMIEWLTGYESLSPIVVITDLGFQEEIDLIEVSYGMKNVVTVQLHRADKTFDGDSRNWVTGLQNITAVNNGTIKETAFTIFDQLKAMNLI